MNPTVAVAFIVLTTILLIYNAHSVKLSRRVKIVVGTIAAVLFTIGTLTWLRTTFNIDTNFDKLLFTQSLSSETLTAPRTAFNMGLVAVMLLTLLIGQTKRWHRYVFYTAAAVVFANSFFVAIGYAFGVSIGQITGFAPMPLTTALCFIAIVYILQSFATPTPLIAKVVKSVTKYQLPTAVFIVGITFTGIIWQQSKLDLEGTILSKVAEDFQAQQNVFTVKSTGYETLALGFRSLFEASTSVTPDEFAVYFNSSGVVDNYPGLNGIAYLSVVPADQKQAFQNKIRTTPTVLSPELSTFTIHPTSAQSPLYVITNIEPDKSNVKQSLGFDVGSEAERRKVLNTARDTGAIAATGTININTAVQGETQVKPGFFITAPIYDNEAGLEEPTTAQQRQERLTGFINASFVYDEVFTDAFKNQTAQNVQFKVFDVTTDGLLYTHNPNAKNIGTTPAYEHNISIGNRVWRLAMFTDSLYGATNLERIAPTTVLVTGSALTLLATLLTLSLARRRESAFAFAQSMTADLNNERNAAIAARNKNDTILASIGDAVFAVDSDQRITLFNNATEAISGFSAEEAIGQPYQKILQFVHEDKDHPDPTFIQRALKGRITHMRNHTYLIRKNGIKIAVADSAAPLRDEQNKITGAIIVFRDVTRESELNRAKDEFVSLASHQLRTPLSAIKWYAELLLTGDAGVLSKDQRAYVQQMADGNQRMIKLVNSLLDVSRIDLNKFINEPTAVNVKTEIDTQLHELESARSSKHIATTTSVASDLPPIMIDPKRLDIILQNLFSNAIKYTPAKGKIAIKVRRATPADHAPDKGHTHKQSILIQVADTGYGIPATQQARVFEKLFRADNARTHDTEGNGLGLYLTKQIVDRLGGKIWFTSTENAGTSFYVLLPLVTKASARDTIISKLSNK